MTQPLTTDHAAVGVYPDRTLAEAALLALEQANIPLARVSLIGGETEAHEAALGHYALPEFVEQDMQHQGEREGIWLGGLFGLLLGFGTFFLPGFGVLVVLGPLAGLLGGMGLGAAMGDVTGELTFRDIAADYRDRLVAGNFLVIVHCTEAEAPGVKKVLESTQPLSVTSHPMVLRTSTRTNVT